VKMQSCVDNLQNSKKLGVQTNANNLNASPLVADELA